MKAETIVGMFDAAATAAAAAPDISVTSPTEVSDQRLPVLLRCEQEGRRLLLYSTLLCSTTQLNPTQLL